jgi:predicted nucleotidyltransferase
MIEANFSAILPLLANHGVEFILIGGGAGIAHGLARATYDVDVVYRRSDENLRRVVESLRDCQPYLRGAPPGLPFRWDLATLRSGLNFTLTTSVGNLDLLGEVTGGGSYDQLLPLTEEFSFHGVVCRVVTLDHLIHLKRAAGRPKDLETIAELQLLLAEKRRKT